MSRSLLGRATAYADTVINHLEDTHEWLAA